MNLAKCQLWGSGADGLVGAGPPFPSDTPIDSPIRAAPVSKYSGGKGIPVLGTPIDPPTLADDPMLGSTTHPNISHTDAVWQSTVDKAGILLHRLRLLPEGQLQHLLLRHCLDACMINNLLRTTSLSSGSQAVAAFSDKLRHILEDIIGDSLTANAWLQATLPISKGGMGIRDPLQVRPAARVAALVAFHSSLPTAWAFLWSLSQFLMTPRRSFPNSLSG